MVKALTNAVSFTRRFSKVALPVEQQAHRPRKDGHRRHSWQTLLKQFCTLPLHMPKFSCEASRFSTNAPKYLLSSSTTSDSNTILLLKERGRLQAFTSGLSVHDRTRLHITGRFTTQASALFRRVHSETVVPSKSYCSGDQ